MYNGVIQMKRLGDVGRWGNQIFQYMFLRVYGKRNNLQVVTPVWRGTYIYNLNDCNKLRHLKRIVEKNVYRSSDSKVIGRKNVDVKGNFFYETSWYAPDKEFIQDIFTPAPEYSKNILRNIEHRREGRPLVCIHVRLGDFLRLRKRGNKFFIAPYTWYHDAIDSLGLKRYSLFISTDSHKSVLPNFSDYKYFSWSSKKANPFWDFYTLTRCDYILASNSTFSLSASMIGNPRRCMRPDPYKGCFVEYDPWDMTFDIESENEAKT